MPVTSEVVALVNVLPAPYLLLSPDFLIEAASDAYLHATLTSRERLVGQYLFDAFPDNPLTPEAQSVHNLRASLQQVLATGQPHQMAPQHYDVPDPAHPSQFVERHWLCTNRLVRDANDQVVHLLHAAVDITDQHRAERRLRDSQAAEQAARAETEAQRQRFYEVLMQLPAYVAVYHGPDHVYQLVNPSYQRLFPNRTFVGRSFREGIPEADGLGVVALFDRVYQTGEPYYAHEMEGWFDFKGTGEPEQVFLNLSLHPLRNAQGRIDGVLDYSSDVTEQVRARQQIQTLNHELEDRVQARTQELAQQQRLLDQILRQVPAAVATFTGPTHQFTFFNDRYQQFVTGRAQVGQAAADVLPDVAAQGFIALLDNIYATGQPYRGQESLVELADQATGQLARYYFNSLYQPLTDAQGQTQGILVFALEVTEQMLARQQVQALNQALAATNDSLTVTNQQLTRTNVDLDTFVYTASHDLKAPITNIESITLALRDTLPAEVQQDEMIAHLLDLLEQTTKRFQLTIGQLTDLSKLQLAHAGPAEPVHLAAVIESVRLDLAPAIVAAEVRLTVEVASDLLVSFSPANLRSAIYNLLSNAIKYRALDRPCQVGVRAARTELGVILTVTDNGLGLNAHQRQRLFGLFQRLHTHVEGTGVGLYITKRLVENGGGTIAVESLVDVGTTFTLTFPA